MSKLLRVLRSHLAAIQAGETLDAKEKAFAKFWAFVKSRSGKLVPGLITLLHEESSFARCFVVDAPGLIGPPAAAAIPALRDKSNENDEMLRVCSALALRRINPKIKVRIPRWATDHQGVPLSQAHYLAISKGLRETLEEMVREGWAVKSGEGNAAEYRILRDFHFN